VSGKSKVSVIVHFRLSNEEIKLIEKRLKWYNQGAESVTIYCQQLIKKELARKR
jgi:hypothetical protein